MSTSIGLDIGSSAVRAVQVSFPGRGPATLERVGQVVLPPGAVVDGEITDVDAVGEALRALWSRYRLRGRKIALGVANQQVIVRQVDLPYLPESELRETLPFTAAEHIPIPVDQAILDLHVLEHYENDEGERFSRVLLVAAQMEMINRLVDVARAAKLEPILIDLQAFALLRSLVGEHVPTPGEGELLVDIGAAVTNLVIHEDGAPRFVRILLMGGETITADLVEELGISRDAAEAAKVARGDDPAAAGLIADQAGRFVDEVRGSLDYYRSQPDAVPVRRVILTGGGSQLPQLPEQMASALRVPVDRGHPMAALKIGKVGISTDELVEAEPFLAVAIGLALGAPGGSVK